MTDMKDKCNCPENNKGGFMVCEDCSLQIQKDSIIFVNKLLQIFTFRLLCEAKKGV